VRADVAGRAAGNYRLAACAPQKTRLAAGRRSWLQLITSHWLPHGRGCGVGRGRGVTLGLGVAVGVGVGVGVGEGVGVGLGPGP
jgi:hypothetical protein